MILPIQPAPSCAQAWLAAVNQLIQLRGEAYNLVLDIDNPAVHSDGDRAIIMEVDRFLKARNVYPIATVANTIFPQGLLLMHGRSEFKKEYLRSYDAIQNKGWGRYFERMVRWPNGTTEPTDQLNDLITNMRKQLRARQTFHNVYEMTLFDPARDARRNRNRQCLSFLSFKLHPARGLTLTAIYRNHHYISRALGNFIGLGDLMRFIASEIKLDVGPLTIVSTHAQIDTAETFKGDQEDACKGWTKRDAEALINSAGAIGVSVK